MKTITRISALLVLSIVTAAPSSPSAQILPVGEPGTELFYQWLLHARAAGDSAALDYQVAPYVSRGTSPGAFSYWPQSQTASSANSQIKSPSTLRVYLAPSEEIAGERQLQTATTARVRAGMTARLSEHVSAMSSFILDEGLAGDPTYTGKVWRGLAGDVETAVVSYQNEKLTVLAGRYRTSWGPQYTNLLLSQTAAPLDGASFRYRFGRKLTFSYQLARLDPISPDPVSADTINVFINRYLAAHRIDFRFSNAVRIGLFESVLFAGPGRSVELQFLNPLIFFHGNQLNEDNNDNTFLGFDYDIRIKHKLNLFGQVLVDDFQIDNKTQGDQEPNEIGYLIGGRLNDALPSFDIKMQWNRVTNRTYNQKLPRNRYLNQNRPLGHPLGNDFETYRLDILRWFGREQLLRLSGIIQRRGQGRITDPWSEPWLATSGPYSEPYLTGTVERTSTLELGYQTLFSGFFSGSSGSSGTNRQGLLRATLGWKTVKNEANLAGVDRNSFYIRLNFSLFLAADIKPN